MIPTPKHGIEFVLMAPSEDGFWSNVFGWTYDIADATRFSREEIEEMDTPTVTGNDCEWVAVAFDDLDRTA
jgi:hypothetical protein